jgi:glycosyltransferase involved in cell wall biosynthesis
MIEILSTVDTSKSFQAIEQKRALVIERLQAAKLCEVMGKEPWSLIPNSAYNQCDNSCISVIVSLFNYSEYIYECLDSISNSEFSDLPGQIEVLVVDDCSTDRSASMVEEYMAKSSLPICLIKKSFNTGLADARNVGLKVARSPYVFILDADNWIHPNCLSILYHTINSSIYAGVYSSIRRINHQTREEAGLISCEEWNVQKLVECPYIDAMAMLNREILLKVGGYSTELIEYGWFGWEDYDLWLKLAQQKYSCKLVSKVLSSYRVHPTSMINTTNYYTLIIAKYFSNKFSDLVKNYWKSDKLFGFEQNEIFSRPQPEDKPEDKLEQTKNQLEHTGKKLEYTQNKLEYTEKKLEHTEKHFQELQQEMEKKLHELQQAHTTIAAIQSSKFWQVRNNWFKFKKLLGWAESTEVKI